MLNEPKKSMARIQMKDPLTLKCTMMFIALGVTKKNYWCVFIC